MKLSKIFLAMIFCLIQGLSSGQESKINYNEYKFPDVKFKALDGTKNHILGLDQVQNGSYFIRIQSDQNTVTTKLMILK